MTSNGVLSWSFFNCWVFHYDVLVEVLGGCKYGIEYILVFDMSVFYGPWGKQENNANVNVSIISYLNIMDSLRPIELAKYRQTDITVVNYSFVSMI